jgi:signal transduction histidine kinase
MKKASKLLLIADRRAQTIEESLRSANGDFEITIRMDVPAEVTALKAMSFDAILLDMTIPGLNRTEMVMRLLDMAPGLPVILVAGSEDPASGGAKRNPSKLDYKVYRAVGLGAKALPQAIEEGTDAIRGSAGCETAESRAEKELLASHLSHECRNALACIHQFGHILNDGLAGELSPEQRDYIGIMLDNASRIREVVDDLLEPGRRKEKLAKALHTCL